MSHPHVMVEQGRAHQSGGAGTTRGRAMEMSPAAPIDGLSVFEESWNADGSPGSPRPAIKQRSLKCPTCGEPTIQIIYGMPDFELFEQAERGEVALGGCCLPLGDEANRVCTGEDPHSWVRRGRDQWRAVDE